jgi:hypothetical protein
MADFETVSEPFSVYTLSDGSQMLVKHVLVEAIPTGLNAEGKPQYNLRFAPVVDIQPRPIRLGGQHSLANQQFQGLNQNAQNALNLPKKDLQ